MQFQTAKMYMPSRVRSALVPVVNLAYVFLAGVLLNVSGMTVLAILALCIYLLVPYSYASLPEIDASRRGLAFGCSQA